MKPLTAAFERRARRHLLALTNLPTATGREERVIAWIDTWARGRAVRVRRDRYGNRLIERASVERHTSAPLIFSAHLDHPAFVVSAVEGDGWIVADFRGGVQPAYFPGTRVRLWPESGARGTLAQPVTGRIEVFTPAAARFGDAQVRIRLPRQTPVQIGQVLTWHLPPARIRAARQGERLEAPVCDNLAAVAAALVAFERLLGDATVGDVRLLLTRAEEVGFIGAMGAARSGLIPPAARLVVLENSKAMPDAPLGAGPIVRVGDRSSTFDPVLTGLMAAAAERLAEADPGFRWQRKLMTGGTCEATAFLAFGFQATCLCLPLGHYHNMDETRGRIGPETIAVSDYLGLIRLIVAAGGQAGDHDPAIHPLRDRLDALFSARSALLES